MRTGSGPPTRRSLDAPARTAQCFELQLFRYSVGRIETPQEACALGNALPKSAPDARDVLTAIVTGTGFVQRTLP